MGPQGAPGVIWRSPQPSKNEPKTHQKMTPTCPYALPEHENCKFHRIQKLYKNQTFINHIFSASRSANGAPKVDLEAQKWSENSTKTHRANSAPTSELRKKQAGGSFSPLRTSWKGIICAFESWDRARQHSKDTGAHNKSSAVQNLKIHVARRRHRAEHQNSPAHPSTVTRFARARGLLCIFASIYQWPPRAFSCCSSCPQGFI